MNHCRAFRRIRRIVSAVALSGVMMLCGHLAGAEELTWEQYMAMTEEQQQGFFDSFSDPELFDDWAYEAYMSAEAELPDEGKDLFEYTLVEYENMSAKQKDLFRMSFDNAELFELWLYEAQLKADMEAFRGVYMTYAEFESMSPAQKELYSESFMNAEGFGLWMASAQANSKVYGDRQLFEYSMKEFENMDDECQKVFLNTFENEAAFDAWQMFENWKEANKQIDCTWEEFMNMDAAQQEAIYEMFESNEAFEAWKRWAQTFGNRRVEEFTRREFEAMDNAKREVFYEAFENNEMFEEWLARAR